MFSQHKWEHQESERLSPVEEKSQVKKIVQKPSFFPQLHRYEFR